MALYEGGKSGQCPHCMTIVQFQNVSLNVVGIMTKEPMKLITVACPCCGKLIITAVRGIFISHTGQFEEESDVVIWPTLINRALIPEQVPKHIANDYKEAFALLNISQKASAALSRKCLQSLLKEAGNSNNTDLLDQINEISCHLPKYISENLETVKEMSDFARYPSKHKDCTIIADVEPGEAEWNLEVLDMLFNFYYVQPEVAKQKRQALNERFQAGRRNNHR